MPDKQHTQDPARDAESQPLTPTPFESAIEQRIVALEANRDACKESNKPDDLVAAVKKGEWWLIGINGLLLIATVVIACIYYRQLGTMQSQLVQSTNATNDATLTRKLSVCPSFNQFSLR
jgi:hypothetical protein